jgi:ATPase subunit of ABC transporter with duplicated ATPase domains
MHKPIKINALGLSFPHKICFQNFSATINHGDRIGIIGNNGAGKSTLLKMLAGQLEPHEGSILMPPEVRIGLLPQVILESEALSGGERLNEALTKILAGAPDCLLLDEATNHLDLRNRRTLLRMLMGFSHTLIVVSHDLELLRNIDIIWHIDQGYVQVFKGKYDDYRRQLLQQRSEIEKKISELNRQKQATHDALMKEQARAKSSRQKGEKNKKQAKWSPMVAGAKSRQAEQTTGRLKSALNEQRHDLVEKLSTLKAPEVIQATFYLTSADIGEQTILSISNGSVGYEQPILKDVYLSEYK